MPTADWSARLEKAVGKSSVHVVSAVVVMGGWATFANLDHGAAAAAKAGLVQGAASALVTLTLKKALESMSSRLSGGFAFVVPPAVSCSVVLALLATAHRLAGTRELWSTIAIPYAGSTIYAWVFAGILAKRRRPGEVHA